MFENVIIKNKVIREKRIMVEQEIFFSQSTSIYELKWFTRSLKIPNLGNSKHFLKILSPCYINFSFDMIHSLIAFLCILCIHYLPLQESLLRKKKEKKEKRKGRNGEGTVNNRRKEIMKERRQADREAGWKLDYTCLDAIKLSHQVKFPSRSLLECLHRN